MPPDATTGLIPAIDMQALLSDVALLGDRALVGRTSASLAELTTVARARLDAAASEAIVSVESVAEAADIYAVVLAAAERQRTIELLLAEGLDTTHLPAGVTASGVETLTRGLAEALRLSGLPADDVVSVQPKITKWVKTVQESGLWSTRPERFQSISWGGRIMKSTEVAQGVMEGRLQQVVADSAAATDAIGPTGLTSMLRTARKNVS